MSATGGWPPTPLLPASQASSKANPCFPFMVSPLQTPAAVCAAVSALAQSESRALWQSTPTAGQGKMSQPLSRPGRPVGAGVRRKLCFCGLPTLPLPIAFGAARAPYALLWLRPWRAEQEEAVAASPCAACQRLLQRDPVWRGAARAAGP